MPRRAREKSVTGIYHVMLRGTNRQDIFEDRADYWKFLKLLHQQTSPEDELGHPQPPRCTVYAYCLMTNHVHLLIRAAGVDIASPMRSIAISYVQYFNAKYDHSGHLFQDRYKSEPVNQMSYFITLLRYIHQNPVAGGMVRKVEDYAWSSWCEYDGSESCAFRICDTEYVFNQVSPEELYALVNEPLPKAMNILDFNNEAVVRVSDELLRAYFSEICQERHPKALLHHDREERNRIILQLKKYGGSIRQISRITGVSEGIIRNVK